jgi:hypothetical protein
MMHAAGHQAGRDVVRLCTIAAELTADRFSLLATGGELEATVRLDVANVTFDSPRALGVRELEHLAKLCQRVEAREVPVFHEREGYWNGYPSSPFRMFATWLFWRSEVHRELTGVGPADIALRDVDAMLRARCEEELARERAERSTKPGASIPRPEPPAAPVEAPHAPARRAQPSLGQGAKAAVATVGRLIAGVVGRHESERAQPSVNLPLEEVDEVELQFRALERQAAQEATATPAVPDDLEAQFRALEERERSGGFEG